MEEISNVNFSFKELFSPLTTAKAKTIICIVCLVVYFNSFLNGFVWDDLPQYINNPLAHSIINIPQILMYRNATFYRPFPTIVFASFYSIFGATAFWYHLFQVILHLINTILIFLLFKKFVSREISLFLSLIFLIHPINVETVAYISATQTVLSLFFGLLVLFCVENKHIRFIYKYILIFFFLLLSILSKETGWLFFILIPFFMALVKINKFPRKDYIAYSLVCFLIFVIYGCFILAFPASKGALTAPIPILHATLFVRLITLPKIIFYYLYTFIYPKNLGVTQQWLVTNIDLHDFIFPLIVDVIFFLSMFLAGAYIARKSRKMIVVFLFFMIWFLMSSTLSWQIFPLEMTVADRWFYFPMIGLLGMFGILLYSFNMKSTQLKYVIFSLAILIIVGYSFRTVVRIGNWKDGVTLFSHDRTVSYNSYDLYDNLGYNYLLLQRYEEAKPYLDESIRLAPGSWETWLNLGTYYGNTGQSVKALRAFSAALAINQNYYPAYLNIARIYYYNNKLSEASSFLATRALVKFSQDPYLWSVKGAADYRLGYKQKGMDEVQKAYNLSKEQFYLNMFNLMQNNQDISNL